MAYRHAPAIADWPRRLRRRSGDGGGVGNEHCSTWGWCIVWVGSSRIGMRLPSKASERSLVAISGTCSHVHLPGNSRARREAQAKAQARDEAARRCGAMSGRRAFWVTASVNGERQVPGRQRRTRHHHLARGAAAPSRNGIACQRRDRQRRGSRWPGSFASRSRMSATLHTPCEPPDEPMCWDEFPCRSPAGGSREIHWCCTMTNDVQARGLDVLMA